MGLVGLLQERREEDASVIETYEAEKQWLLRDWAHIKRWRFKANEWVSFPVLSCFPVFRLYVFKNDNNRNGPVSIFRVSHTQPHHRLRHVGLIYITTLPLQRHVPSSSLCFLSFIFTPRRHPSIPLPTSYLLFSHFL